MRPRLYDELVPWYLLLDPPEDHAEEARCFRDAFERVVTPAPQTLLELGSGAGNTALHLTARFRCTLTDLSEPMLALSRTQNSESEHVMGDMRSLRLGRTFDCVLVHDAITYMTTEADLAAAVQTAWIHTRVGGAAVFVPDDTTETFEEETEVLSSERGGRSMRTLMWSWDPDPGDTTCRTDYAIMIRDGDKVQAAHDTHIEGLFPRATWIRLLQHVGFSIEPLPRPLGDGSFDQAFLCLRRE